MKLDANGPELYVADEVDENGVIDFTVGGRARVDAYGALTETQARELASHLLEVVNRGRKPKLAFEVGDLVQEVCDEEDPEKIPVGRVVGLSAYTIRPLFEVELENTRFAGRRYNYFEDEITKVED